MKDGFLVKWAESSFELAQKPVGCTEPQGAPPDLVPHDQQGFTLTHGVPWAEWKAAALNLLFQDQGVTREPGRISAVTILHGERNLSEPTRTTQQLVHLSGSPGD
jgi:hypothetical protein